MKPPSDKVNTPNLKKIGKFLEIGVLYFSLYFLLDKIYIIKAVGRIFVTYGRPDRKFRITSYFVGKGYKVSCKIHKF